MRSPGIIALVLFGGCGYDAPDGGALAATEAGSSSYDVRGVTVIPDTIPRCRECYSLEPMGVIGSPSDPNIMEAIPSVVRLSDGTYTAVPLFHERHPIIRYERDGRYLGTVGRTGDGPGEYRFVNSLSADADGNLVVIHDGAYITHFSGAGEFVRKIRVQPRVPRTGVAMRNDYLLAGALRTPSAVGYPLHAFDSGGSYVHSFGAMDTSRMFGTQDRIISVQPNGVIWAAQGYNYVIERFDSAMDPSLTIGVLLPRAVSKTLIDPTARDSVARTVVRGSAESGRVMPPGPPFAITGIIADNGKLYVTATVLRPNWTDLAAPPDVETTEPNLLESTVQEFYRSMIDVIDLTTMTLESRLHIDGWVELSAGPLLVQKEYSPEGYIQMRAYAIRKR